MTQYVVRDDGFNKRWGASGNSCGALQEACAVGHVRHAGTLDYLCTHACTLLPRGRAHDGDVAPVVVANGISESTGCAQWTKFQTGMKTSLNALIWKIHILYVIHISECTGGRNETSATVYWQAALRGGKLYGRVFSKYELQVLFDKTDMTNPSVQRTVLYSPYRQVRSGKPRNKKSSV